MTDAPSPRPLHVLWDVDGTLLLNSPRSGSMYHRAIELAAGASFEDRTVHAHGKTDGQIIWETLDVYGLPESLHPAVRAELEGMSRIEHYGAGRREVPVGVPRLVADVADRGWVNALLTGNSPLRARYKLDGAGLDVDLFDWDASFFGDEARIRSDLTRRAAAALAGVPVVIIGDTPADGVAAEAAGFPFVAVSTGAYDVAQLRQPDAHAAIVVEDLASGHDEVMAYLDGLVAP
ncbi:phosphoglycolate phosphatase [Clavibacter sp. B3I6]|uniref:HAD family hydrolase n=1 Tax=Clavibacter sp. B3I6 TaxID=3042268 RepID=UPI0027836560|nr:HAD hydrolase-like protein [Clavibacter sp. B3I6]MDQ0743188.1 phosphoglycolate phosphatase [Clavibacter sp. B3I6]